MLWPRFWLGLVAASVGIGLGVAYTPRFDHSIREELAWDNVFQGIDEKETQLAGRNKEQLAQFQNSAENRADYVRWISAELIPFYADLDQRLEALNLKPGRVTAKRREAVVRALQTKLAGLQHLLRGVQQNDSNEMALYGAAERDVDQQMKQIQAM